MRPRQRRVICNNRRPERRATGTTSTQRTEVTVTAIDGSEALCQLLGADGMPHNELSSTAKLALQSFVSQYLTSASEQVTTSVQPTASVEFPKGRAVKGQDSAGGRISPSLRVSGVFCASRSAAMTVPIVSENSIGVCMAWRSFYAAIGRSASSVGVSSRFAQ